MLFRSRFVLRRANLAIERIELRLLGPEYKSPRLLTDEIMASTRFINGMKGIPGATSDKAEQMLNELATGWSRFSVDLIPNLGRAVFSRGFDPRIDYDAGQIEAMRQALADHPAVLLWSHRSYLDGVIVPVALQENKLPPAHTVAGINLSFGFMGPLMRRSGFISQGNLPQGPKSVVALFSTTSLEVCTSTLLPIILSINSCFILDIILKPPLTAEWLNVVLLQIDN